MNSSPRQQADEWRVKRKERERDENENCQITVNLISFIRIPFVIVSMESDLLCLQTSYVYAYLSRYVFVPDSNWNKSFTSYKITHACKQKRDARLRVCVCACGDKSEERASDAADTLIPTYRPVWRIWPLGWRFRGNCSVSARRCDGHSTRPCCLQSELHLWAIQSVYL